MIIKNENLFKLYNCIVTIGERQSDIKNKWELSKLLKKVADGCNLVQSQIQTIIETQGVENEEGVKVISQANEDYLTLMKLDIDLDIEITIKELEKYNPTMEELIALSPVIKE